MQVHCKSDISVLATQRSRRLEETGARKNGACLPRAPRSFCTHFFLAPASFGLNCAQMVPGAAESDFGLQC